MLEHTDTVDLPTYAVCAVEYGDMSGLDDTDIENINNFLAKYNQPIFEYGEETYFTHCPTFGLAMDCVECKVFEERD